MFKFNTAHDYYTHTKNHLKYILQPLGTKQFTYYKLVIKTNSNHRYDSSRDRLYFSSVKQAFSFCEKLRSKFGYELKFFIEAECYRQASEALIQELDRYGLTIQDLLDLNKRHASATEAGRLECMAKCNPQFESFIKKYEAERMKTQRGRKLAALKGSPKIGKLAYDYAPSKRERVMFNNRVRAAKAMDENELYAYYAAFSPMAKSVSIAHELVSKIAAELLKLLHEPLGTMKIAPDGTQQWVLSKEQHELFTSRLNDFGESVTETQKELAEGFAISEYAVMVHGEEKPPMEVEKKGPIAMPAQQEQEP